MNAGKSKQFMPGEKEFFQRLEARHRRGRFGTDIQLSLDRRGGAGAASAIFQCRQ